MNTHGYRGTLTPQEATSNGLREPVGIPVRGLYVRQAFKPSAHVWSKLGSPVSPQLSNQAPPRRQQLNLPALPTPHLGHALEVVLVLVAIVVVASVDMQRQ